jgi:hypothetical protein
MNNIYRQRVSARRPDCRVYLLLHLLPSAECEACSQSTAFSKCDFGDFSCLTERNFIRCCYSRIDLTLAGTVSMVTRSRSGTGGLRFDSRLRHGCFCSQQWDPHTSRCSAYRNFPPAIKAAGA